MYLQASKNMFEGLSAKLSEHLHHHDTRPPASALEESTEARELAANGHILKSVSRQHETLLHRLSLKGKVSVQPGGCAPPVAIMTGPLLAAHLHQASLLYKRPVTSGRLPLHPHVFPPVKRTSYRFKSLQRFGSACCAEPYTTDMQP